MGVILSFFGVSEPQLALGPQKIIVGSVLDTQIPLAYILNIILYIFVIVMSVLLEFGVIPAVKQGFYCGDPLISHTYRGDTITPEILGVTAILLLVVVVISTEILERQSFRNINWYTVIFYINECVMGVLVTLLVTSIAKVIVGEPRPHFLHTCRPDSAVNCTPGVFIDTYECTSTDYISVIDSAISFPSGHSSISWFIGIFLSYIVHSKMVTVNSGYISKLLMITTCLTWSMLCSLSRITDRRHHWWDVLAGSALGTALALYFIKIINEKRRDNLITCSTCLEKQVQRDNRQMEYDFNI